MLFKKNFEMNPSEVTLTWVSVEATIIKATGISFIVLQVSKSFLENPDIVKMKEFYHVILCPWLSVMMPQVVIWEDQ